MSARESRQTTHRTTPSSEPTAENKRPDLLTLIFDDFINAHALITVAYRLIEEFDDEDRGAAVLVLGQGVQALNGVSDKLENVRRSEERLRGKRGAA